MVPVLLVEVFDRTFERIPTHPSCWSNAVSGPDATTGAVRGPDARFPDARARPNMGWAIAIGLEAIQQRWRVTNQVTFGPVTWGTELG